MAPSGILLLLGLLSSVTSLPSPRISFTINSADRPLHNFSLPDVHNTTKLLLSNDSSTLYVGARNAILSLDVSQSDVITLKKKVEWSPSQGEIEACQNKGKNPTVDCPNFIHALQQINSTHLYTCGSYAYSPRDAFIDVETFSIIQHDDTKKRCPYNPFQRNTAITIDGELFTATTTNFKGDEPHISRHFSKDRRPDVSQDSSVSLLQDPTFVSSSLDPAEGKLYFFFSEVGKEFSFVDKLQIARVAQVCKDDVGGQRTLQRKWTSFAKAPLLCQSPKQLPFNILQDMFTLQPPESNKPSDTLFYGVFTSQWSLSPESAVCVFKLQDLKTVFTGSYKTFDMQSNQWSLLQGQQHSKLGQCGLDKESDSMLAEVKKTFLTSNSVKPVGDGPILVSSKQSYSRVAAMRTKAANGKEYTVLFLLTETGFLHKVVLFDQGAHIIEEIQVFTQPQLVKSMVLSSSKGVLYVGTSERVTAVPVAKCSIYRSCTQCVLARDPLCGWSRTRRACVGLDSSPDNIAQVLENSNVEEECDGQTETSVNTDINVHVNQVVRLNCLKPSNLATLTWTSGQFKIFPKELFIQSAEGSLQFCANTTTFGSYHCEAEEGGHKEVIKSYNVQQTVSPRSLNPPVSETTEESYDKVTEEPLISIIPPSGDPDDYPLKNKDGESVVTKDNAKTNKEEPISKNIPHGDGLGSIPTSGRDGHSWKEPLNTQKEKSYHSELVVVSLMLVICICILMVAGLYMWRQRKTDPKLDGLISPEDGSKVNQCMESVPSLSCPEDVPPELKVVE